MKTRMATRYTATYPPVSNTPSASWHGTCPEWARNFPADAVVTAERILVVNPTTEPCNCGSSHVRLPAKEK